MLRYTQNGVIMKKDAYIKILLAFELALLPLAIFAKIFLPTWSLSLFVSGILLCKIWREVFRDKAEKSHLIMSLVANIATNTTLIVLFMNLGLLSKVIGIIAIIAVWLESACKYVMFYVEVPEFVDAVSYCNLLFQMLMLLSMTFAYANSTFLAVACIACILTSTVYVGYTAYHFIKNMPKKSR